MSEVRFTTARECAPTITIISAAEYPKVFVSLAGPDGAVSGEVHYVEALRRSVPHMQRDCQHCMYPMITKTWVPAAMCPMSFGQGVMEMAHLPMLQSARRSIVNWQRKVVELPPSAMMLATTLERGTLFAIVRGKGREHKKVYGKIFRDIVAPVPDLFDVRPFLLKTWGIKQNQCW